MKRYFLTALCTLIFLTGCKSLETHTSRGYGDGNALGALVGTAAGLVLGDPLTGFDLGGKIGGLVGASVGAVKDAAGAAGALASKIKPEKETFDGSVANRDAGVSN